MTNANKAKNDMLFFKDGDLQKPYPIWRRVPILPIYGRSPSPVVSLGWELSVID